MSTSIIKIITNESYKEQFSNFDSSFFTEVLSGYKLPKATIKSFIEDTEILLISIDSVMSFDKELIDAAKNIKYISIDTSDYSWIDTEYAKEKGVIISNNPYITTESVAEHVMAFMLNFAKRIHHAYRDLYLNNKKMVLRPGTELKGKTLGIIGYGHIGARLAEIARAFGMNVIAWNRTKKSEDSHIIDLDTVLSQSDFLSLNLATNNETKGFLNSDRINKLKKGVFIVNLADKSLVDLDALSTKIETGNIAGYGIEFWEIDGIEEHPIYSHENVIAFNGFGWYTKDAINRTFDGMIRNVKEYLKGNVINRVA